MFIMELKDWFILLIPIICNGLLIFYFQSVITYKLKKAEKHDEFVLKIINTFSEMVLDEYESLIFLSKKCSFDPREPRNNEPFEELRNTIPDKHEKIYNYYKIHKTIFEKYKISIKTYVNAYEDLISAFPRDLNHLFSDVNRLIIFDKITLFETGILFLYAQLERINCKK